jgi:hypothetical protein
MENAHMPHRMARPAETVAVMVAAILVVIVLLASPVA